MRIIITHHLLMHRTLSQRDLGWSTSKVLKPSLRRKMHQRNNIRDSLSQQIAIRLDRKCRKCKEIVKIFFGGGEESLPLISL